MSDGFERHDRDDVWSGHRPRYESIGADGTHYFLNARLRSGEPIRCRLAPRTLSALRGGFIVEMRGARRRGVVERLHNPRGRACACPPECWCMRSRLGYALRWYLPARFHLPPSQD